MADYINVNFDEDNNEILLKPNTFTMPGLCEEIGESYSTVRYWITMFGDYLETDLNVRNKKFSPRDVELFKFIKKLLKENNFTINQTKEYLRDNIERFDNNVVIESPEQSSLIVQKIVQNEMVAIKEEIITSVTKQVGTLLLQMQHDYLMDVKKDIITSIEQKLGNEIRTSTSKELTSKLEQIQQIENKIDRIELQSNQHMNEITQHMRENIELRKRIYELEQQKNKSFFKKIFNR